MTDMSKPGNLWRKFHGRITKKPTNFSWLIEDKLAGSGIPTSFDEFNLAKKEINELGTKPLLLPLQLFYFLNFLNTP